MNLLELKQAIITFLDENDGTSYSEFKQAFPTTQAAILFEQMLQAGMLRQIIANPLLGTYKYHLPS